MLYGDNTKPPTSNHLNLLKFVHASNCRTLDRTGMSDRPLKPGSHLKVSISITLKQKPKQSNEVKPAT